MAAHAWAPVTAVAAAAAEHHNRNVGLRGVPMRHLVMGLAAALALASAGALAQQPETMAVPADYRQWVFLTSSLDLNYTTAAAPRHHMLDHVLVNPQAH